MERFGAHLLSDSSVSAFQKWQKWQSAYKDTIMHQGVYPYFAYLVMTAYPNEQVITYLCDLILGHDANFEQCGNLFAACMSHLPAGGMFALVRVLSSTPYARIALAVLGSCSESRYSPLIRLVARYAQDLDVPTIVARFITRNADGRVVAPDCTPPHVTPRLSNDYAVNAWLWLILGDGHLDDAACSVILPAKLISYIPGVDDGFYPADVIPILSGLYKANRHVSALSMRNSATLCEASRSGNLDAVKALVEARVDVNGRNDRGETPLHVVSELNTALYLLDQNAHVDAIDGTGIGYTPLHMAVGSGFGSLAITLLLRHANVNARDSLGNTPLFYSTCVDMVNLLVRYEADLFARNRENQLSGGHVREYLIWLRRRHGPGLLEYVAALPLRLVRHVQDHAAKYISLFAGAVGVAGYHMLTSSSNGTSRPQIRYVPVPASSGSGTGTSARVSLQSDDSDSD
jgi:hypothetical protein